MDTIFYNANIYTMDEARPKVEAIAIRGETIFALGNNEDVLKYKGEFTKLVNLKNQTILPGFHDSHLHLYMTGELLGWVSLLQVSSKAQALAMLAKEVENQDNENTLIMGHGWNQDYFTDDKTFLTKDDLDLVSKDHPVVLYRACGHIATLNSKALKFFNMTEDVITSDGRIDIKTGIVYENALEAITKNRPQPTLEQIQLTLKRAINHANQHGITSVQSDDFFSYPGGHKAIIEAYQDLIEAKDLTLRVYEQSLIPSLDGLRDFIKEGYHTGFGNNLFKIGPIKLIGDGSLGARTAAMTEDYHDDAGNKGILNYDDETLYQLIKTAHTNNFQLAIHAIGDATMEQLLALYARVLKEHPKEDHRHGIVHCQIMNQQQIQRMSELNLVAYVQPIFVHYDQRIVESRVGKDLSKTSYAFKTMINSGLRVALGTDSPIESLNPIENIYCAVTRKTLDGKNPGWNVQECLTVTEAVKHYTKESSYASFEENNKGILRPGYLADLVVLDRDLFAIDSEEIKSTNVIMTILGGKTVYKRND